MVRIQIRPLKAENRDTFLKYFGDRTGIMEVGLTVGYVYKKERVEDSVGF